ncbi:succinate--CoA ligase subunit alpha [Amycolatopsis alkalitolerans]|uniref:Succinate--CoA ligase subunit alpha n=1 Tax=Amycolatopsis alkalitolerans TaxID=2547244 RepID=A0A5C4M2N8_9PSEU|nr:CoA-binding protein [Amycolatopsis alkalitolerans]TNC25160.1 succinate--CoA ligase subunit alpha [Amycolatopsis alkalitolerans]
MIRELMSGGPGLLVQGITGRQGTMETAWMLRSGTRISCGVTPGRGGGEVHGVPVYDSVTDAVAATGATVSMNYVPAPLVPDSLVESAEAGIRLTVVSAENVPLHGFLRAAEHARARGMRVVGPNSQGIVVPQVGRWGCPGGDDPWERFAAGSVGVVSRSGGMASEISLYLRQWGMGTSVQLGLGGSPFVATSMVDAVRIVEDDPKTEAVVVFGEPSGHQEYDLAGAIAAGAVRVPVIALIPGRATETLPSTVPFGHAPMGRLLTDTAAGKLDALHTAGARLAHSLDELRARLIDVLGPMEHS